MTVVVGEWRDFADPATADRLLREIRAVATREWSIMEVCGGQTNAVMRHGIDQLLDGVVRLLHGPGCPVCVTPIEIIDQALAIASQPAVTFCSFGDMLRVPGSDGSLFTARARGADVRVVYSPLDAVQIAADEPDREVVFFAVGFETTAPANALAAVNARERGLRNFSLLVSHVLVPPAIEALLADPATSIDGFLAAGHVCTVMGVQQYQPIARRHRVPIVVTGFELVDLLDGIRRCVLQLEAGEATVENAYGRVVRDGGNPDAQELLAEVFEPCDRTWRGMGEIPSSGWRLRSAFAALDAARRFDVGGRPSVEPPDCHAGAVLSGIMRPDACPSFGTTCTPRTPLGAPMVSAEGACAAYSRYRVPSDS